MQRRQLLFRGGVALGGAIQSARGAHATAAPAPAATPRATAAGARARASDSWADLRAQFNLARDHAHFAGFFLASHPRTVRDAIEAHRRSLDDNPLLYLEHNAERLEHAVAAAAASYLNVNAPEIAFTDSTTMGLGLLYSGLRLGPGQEILTSVHDHYSTEQSLALRAERTGATIKRIELYRRPVAATEGEIVGAISRALTPRTRIVALTWVHSSTGVRLPIRAIADAIAKANAGRAEADRALLCVDGVHGFAAVETTLPDLGCDFFVSGCHKWLFGPRGTGFVWGKPSAWPAASATIPTFYWPAYLMWMKVTPTKELPPGPFMSPGGFHSLEHRWALNEAFALHEKLGKARVAARIHELNRQIKDGLQKFSHVTLHTPKDDALSAGIVCFEVAGLKPAQVVERLLAKKIVASQTPYAVQYARLSAGLCNTPDEIERVLREIRALA